MKVTETFLKGCYVIEPKIFNDKRGYFFESFNKKEFEEKTGLKIDFIQDNEALSNKGVLRGLHFQKGEFAQSKLVRVIKGKIQDVVVDLRKESETFGKYYSIILSEENKKQLFIPKGFAHGYLVLEDETIFAYKCDSFYNPVSESGIYFNDRQLDINWLLNEEELILSERDKNLAILNQNRVL
ncbi:MAG: dTDP-4-dehydrorhamnose 3,5-epimerase [Flavobacteriaceae bacterium]|nr:dTDP-4-dehydrorhamnose 3,5-epimerase [Flavobacteriaceae bacterium]